MTAAIELRGVTKTFGSKVAVSCLDLVVPEGALYGFIGPNGAGKTTTLRMILSILFPDQGEIAVLGCGSALDAKDRIGYLPEERGLYRKMRAGDFLTYIARLKGVDATAGSRRVAQWLDRVGLGEVADKRCEELSKGMQQKLQFVAAVIHEPALLILDEPFSGLDPVNMRLLRELVLEQHRRGATVIFSTHVMIQAEAICQQVVMIHDGVKVMDDDLTAIRSRHDPRTLLFEPLDGTADIDSLASIDGVRRLSRAGTGYELSLAEGTDPAATMRALLAALAVARVEIRRPTLEDIFVQIVTRDEQAPAEDVARLRAALRSELPAGGEP